MKFKAIVIAALLYGLEATGQIKTEKRSYSGIYPHLANYNDEGECGTGAVVPWAGRLWAITYGPHQPFGSSDKLYEITDSLKKTTRAESVGGTPANRMIHRESGQLIIGPYFISQDRSVRTIGPQQAPGRLTGTARHLTDPINKIYNATMEEGFYQVDVNDLKVDTLYEDGNILKARNKTSEYSTLLPGAHGKGLYSGQGVLVYSNNGDGAAKAMSQFDIPSGVLAEWNGKDWKVIRRNQFVEVTGPGGIYGNSKPATDPIWATGWDHRSILLGVRSPKSGWSFFRLPKASHSYDGAHGWNTEWPRIRDIGTAAKPDYLMTMHGMFWSFPKTFSANATAGIRPRSAYLKVIGDFARWQDQLVLGCDDAAQREFLNSRKIKADLPGPGQSNSNLWFISPGQTQKFGPNTAEGAVWLSEHVRAAEASDPFLFAGWKHRSAWLLNEGTVPVNIKLEADITGNNTWKTIRLLHALPGKALNIIFDERQQGEWIRATSSASSKLTLYFAYTDLSRFADRASPIFTGLQKINDREYSGALLYSLGAGRKALGVLAGTLTGSGFKESGYYELNEDMKLEKKDDPNMAAFIKEKISLPKNVAVVEESSVLIIDDKQRRWRLPLGQDKFTGLVNNSLTRICREVATERDLLNMHGTIYELPAENADGFAKIRPVSSHNFTIHDFASYRGMLILSGLESNAQNSSHIIRSDDGKAMVWAGVIDDLWQLGKPVGEGGPWKNAMVTKNIPSDPYLIGFYDKRSLMISHNAASPTKFTVEINPDGYGPWMVYKEVVVQPGQQYNYVFPGAFQARWVRLVSNANCKATAWLSYK